MKKVVLIGTALSLIFAITAPVAVRAQEPKTKTEAKKEEKKEEKKAPVEKKQTEKKTEKTAAPKAGQEKKK